MYVLERARITFQFIDRVFRRRSIGKGVNYLFLPFNCMFQFPIIEEFTAGIIALSLRNYFHFKINEKLKVTMIIKISLERSAIQSSISNA